MLAASEALGPGDEPRVAAMVTCSDAVRRGPRRSAAGSRSGADDPDPTAPGGAQWVPAGRTPVTAGGAGRRRRSTLCDDVDGAWTRAILTPSWPAWPSRSATSDEARRYAETPSR